MITKSLNLVDLDFAGQKNDLIEFLKGQTLFKDYDFEGSNLNILVDLLAYNGNKHAFLTNMLLSEAFLDSAQLTSSVFSHSKDLNYLPRSARSSRANITVDFVATGESQPYIIQKGSSFATLIKNTSYVFSIPETISVSSPNTQFSFTTDVYEGIYVKDSYVYNSTDLVPYPTFRLTNKNIDTTSLTVAVYEDNSTIATPFKYASSLLGLTELDKIFFLQASETGYYEIQFGDGIIGYTPKQNSLIVLDYRITSADLANGAKSFNINFDPTGAFAELNLSTTPSVLTNESATGGAKAEAIESVRYYAPRHFQTQERCVVPADYITLMKINFPEINAITAYGGEELEPARFGYVVISIDIPGLDTLPISKENDYNKFLLPRMPMSIMPLFIDPERTYVQVNTLVRYNINITTNTPNRIESLVSTAIANYNIVELNDFDVTLRFSQLTSDINEADPSIISNITSIKLYKKLNPNWGVSNNYTIDFKTKIVPGLSSTGFTYEYEHVYLQDSGTGDVQVFKYINNQTVIIDTIGTIDYEKGIIIMNDLIFDNYDGNYFKVYVTPADPDVSTMQHTILAIEADEVNMTIQQISE